MLPSSVHCSIGEKLCLPNFISIQRRKFPAVAQSCRACLYLPQTSLMWQSFASLAARIASSLATVWAAESWAWRAWACSGVSSLGGNALSQMAAASIKPPMTTQSTNILKNGFCLTDPGIRLIRFFILVSTFYNSIVLAKWIIAKTKSRPKSLRAVTGIRHLKSGVGLEVHQVS